MPREVKLVLPEEVVALLGPEPGREVMARVAATLCGEGRISFGAAAGLAGFPYVEFLAVLTRYGISLNYSEEDLVEDLKTLGEIFGRRET